jgi:hypothetical protein
VSFVLRLFLVCCAAALLLVPAAPAGSNVSPRLGMYYCSYGLTGWSVHLRFGGRYVQGYADRSGTRIKDVIGSGWYRISGSRITFRTGSLKSFYGAAKTRNRFLLVLHGERQASYSCQR